MKKIITLLLLLCSQHLFSQIIYVDSSATGLNNGSSWANAYTNLQDALASTSFGTIWVAKGVYYPDKGVGQVENNRSASFILKNNVAIYGGFAGTETDLNQRDWLNNETILSGEIDGVADNAGNTYNVVRSDGVNSSAILDGFTITKGGYIIPYVDPGTFNRKINADNYGMQAWSRNFYHLVLNVPFYSTAFLAGIIITGWGSMADASPNEGGGMYNLNASPTITNCRFSANQANFRGGGMYNLGGSPSITNCSFSGNSANQDGGGICNINASPTINNCRFTNWSQRRGGGMYNEMSTVTMTNCSFYSNGSNYDGAGIFNTRSTVTLINCSFWKNRAYDHAGGGMYNELATITLTNCSFSENTAVYGGGIHNYSSSLILTNCILWGNSGQLNNTHNSYPVVTWSIVQGGYIGTNNLDVNPGFVNSAVGDLHLQCGSPAVDAGNNDVVTTTTDLDGKNRIVNSRVDMGVYEAQGKVAYVNKNATGLNDGSSWANAFTSLQDALAQAPICNLPTQLWVASGFYYPDEGTGLTDNDPNASFHLKNGVAIYGGFTGTETQVTQRNSSAYVTILSGDIDGDQTPAGNAYHVITGDTVDYTAVMDGFTIVRGNANGTSGRDGRGGGIHLSSSYSRISNCVLWGNEAREGGALYVAGSLPSFFRCSFSGNSAATGGAIYNAAPTQLTVLNCSFTQNAALNGGAIFNAPGTVLNSTNCLFFENTASGPAEGLYKGGAIYNAGAYVYLTNGSFNANTASPGYGGAIYNEGSSPNITNTILWGDSSEIKNDGSSNPSVSYSLVQGGYAGGTNIIDQDPLFVNAPFGDLHLRGCSPAIDAGTAQGTYFADLDGNPRSMFNGVDIGAYEFQPGGPGGIVYVKGDATGLNDGSSWTNAFTHLQDALALAGSCKALEIWVANGTYYPTDISTERAASFVLQNNVTVLGGFIGNESPEGPQTRRTDKSILSGDIDRDGTLTGNSFHVVRGVDNDLSAAMDGFIITGGNADGAAAPDNIGAGLYLSDASPLITRCTITGNMAYAGAGIYNDHSSPTIGRCIISGNKAAMHGGGIYNYYSSPAITNVLFWKDTATYGGGLYNYYGSSPRVTNCSFVYNGLSQYGGGMYNSNQAYPVITNCIFWGNSSQFYNAPLAAPVVSYAIVQGGYPSGSMIINQDPLFVNAAGGDFHLQKESPANNAGTVNGAPDMDLDGYPRSRVNVDLGAYEYASSTATPLLILSCPEDFTLNSDATSCGTIADFTGDHAATTTGGTAPIIISYAPAPGTLLPVGVNTISVTATDSKGTTRTCSFNVTVMDSTAPLITGISASPSMLFPPNHKMQEVQVNYNSSDNCPGVTTILSVNSNQPQYGTGSGDTGPDWQVVNDHKLKLRAERSGNGGDRNYTITITATDASGNTSTATTTVTVPHDKASMTSAPAATTKEAGSLVVKAVPNPSSESFTLYTESSSILPLSIKVMDVAGRMIESRSGVVANGTLNIGNAYRPGVYYVQVLQGDVLQTIKLVKQNR